MGKSTITCHFQYIAMLNHQRVVTNKMMIIYVFIIVFWGERNVFGIHPRTCNEDVKERGVSECTFFFSTSQWGKGQLREWAQSRRGSLAQHCEQFQVNMSNISKKSKWLLIIILVLASSILRWNEVHCLGAC